MCECDYNGRIIHDSDFNLTDDMNKKIVGFLRLKNNDVIAMYAAKLIEHYQWGYNLITKIQEKIDKCMEMENREIRNRAEKNLIREFLKDFVEILELAKEKKKACCEKKAGKSITITSCRNCPYCMSCAIMPDYCAHPKEKSGGIPGREISNYDIIPSWCKAS